MGTPEFAVPSLQELIQGPDTVVAVVCQPDKKKGRGRKLSPPPVKNIAEQYAIPVLQPRSIRTEAFLDEVKSFNPDLIVVAAYGKILPGSLLHMPPLGTINVHGSLLPKYRGAAPIQWAIINGEQETGVTIMQMDEDMDTGDILLPAAIPIAPDDTAGTLSAKLALLGGKTLAEAIRLRKEDRLPPVKQDDSLATEAPLLSKEMGHLDWRKEALELDCLIRGLDPWPSAYAFLGTTRFRFFRPEVVPGTVKEKPGTLCQADNNGMVISTGKNYLRIREIQPEGKKRMEVRSCIHGFCFPVGEKFN
jgi:methionyl-tRNA formyltransferase